MEPWEEFTDDSTATIAPPKPWEEFQESKSTPPWEEFQEESDLERQAAEGRRQLDLSQPARSSEELAIRNTNAREMMVKELGLVDKGERANPTDLTQPLVTLIDKLGVSPQIISDAVSAMDQFAARASGEVSAEEAQTALAEPSTPPTPVVQAAAGAQQAVIGSLEFFTSPLGIMTLGAGSAPAAVQKTIAAAFVADMARHLPEQVNELARSYVDNDVEGMSRALTGLGLSTAFIAKGAGHVVSKAPKEVTAIETAAQKAEVSGAPATAEALRQAGMEPLPELPAFAKRFNQETLLSRPAWVEPGSVFDKALGSVREAPDKGIDITPVWKALTPDQRQDLIARGWTVRDTRKPGQVILGVLNDALAARKYFAQQTRRALGLGEEPAKPSTATLGITPSPAAASMVRPLAEPSFWKKWFTAAGNLPEDVHRSWLKSRGQIAAEGKQIEFAVRDLYSVLQKEHNISTLDKLKHGMQDVPKEKVALMDQALKGDTEAMGQLSPEVQTELKKMRGHVDRLSQTLIERGLIDEELAVRVGENIGAYLTRSYRIFDDPKWVENIPPQVRQDFIRLLETDLGSREAAEIKAREMLQDWSESGVAREFQRGKLGRKDLTQFMKRKDLAPEVRAVLGEYKDPVLNYARSVTKIARFIGDQEFLSEVRQRGMGEFLFEKGESRPGFEAELAAEESSVMSPLNGLRTSPAIREAFETWQRSRPSDNLFARAYFSINALSKGSKTIGSLLTQFRNLWGQPFFNLMSGHWNFTEYGKSMKAIAADIGLTDDVGWRNYYTRLRELNLVDESAPAGELRDVLRDAGLKDQDFTGFTGEGWARAIRKVAIEGPIKAYRISDEAGKIVGFENEKVFQKRLNPNATPEQIEQMAAERIRNTYPTYSMVPEVVRQFRKQPLFGPFVSFAYEAVRTSYHAMRYAAQDARVDPVVGAARVGGIITAISSGAILAAIGRYLYGISRDEMDDVRRFLPPWARNAQLVPIGKEEDGTLSYINWSYQNPYSYMIDPFVAVLADDNKAFHDKFVDAAAEFIRPFSSEQMLGAAIMDAKRNQTQLGKEVYNPQDPDSEKARKITGHLFEAIEPGTLTRWGKRILPAIADKQPDFGRKLDAKTEIAAELTGVRAERFDFGQGFQFKARRFRQDEQDAEYIFSRTIQRTGSVPDNEVVEAYRQSEQQRFALWRELHRDAQAAMRHGIKRQQIMTDLKDSGLSAGDRMALFKGVYQPRQISIQTLQRAKKARRQLPLDDIRAVQKEMNRRPLASAD